MDHAVSFLILYPLLRSSLTQGKWDRRCACKARTPFSWSHNQHRSLPNSLARDTERPGAQHGDAGAQTQGQGSELGTLGIPSPATQLPALSYPCTDTQLLPPSPNTHLSAGERSDFKMKSHPCSERRTCHSWVASHLSNFQ